MNCRAFTAVKRKCAPSLSLSLPYLSENIMNSRHCDAVCQHFSLTREKVNVSRGTNDYHSSALCAASLHKKCVVVAFFCLSLPLLFASWFIDEWWPETVVASRVTFDISCALVMPYFQHLIYLRMTCAMDRLRRDWTVDVLSGDLSWVCMTIDVCREISTRRSCVSVSLSLLNICLCRCIAVDIDVHGDLLLVLLRRSRCFQQIHTKSFAARRFF